MTGRVCWGHGCPEEGCGNVVHEHPTPADRWGDCPLIDEPCGECAALTPCVWCGARRPVVTLTVNGEPFHVECFAEQVTWREQRMTGVVA